MEKIMKRRINRAILGITTLVFLWGSAVSIFAGGLGFGEREATPESDKALATNFANPPAGYGEVPFWWWTGEKLNQERLLWELEEIHKKGISGVQVNYAHSDDKGWPTYPNDPEIFTDDWWRDYSAVSKRCSELGMGIGLSGYTLDWQSATMNLFNRIIYNEKAIQSRQLTFSRMNSSEQEGSDPKDKDTRRSITIDRSAEETPEGVCLVAVVAYERGENGQISPETARLLWLNAEKGEKEFSVTFDAEPTTEIWCYSTNRRGHSLNPLHPESGQRVIEKFFQPFVDHSPTKSSDGLNYFFQDELQLGTGPLMWYPDLPDEFQKRKGYSIFEALPVFFGIDCGDRGVKYRLDFFDVRVTLAEERYFKPIFDWHNSRGMIYGCDPGGRGYHPFEFFDYFRAISWYTAPGHDTPGGAADFIKNKVSSSIAHFYQRPRVWLEGYHSLGWGATPEKLLRVTCENYIYGANLLNLHGLYYTTYGSHWEWAPPCYHFRMPYWEHFGVFLKYFERLSYLTSQGIQRSDIVILYPVSDYQADTDGDGAKKVAFDTARQIYNAGWNILFIDDQSLARCETVDGKLRLNHSEYSTLILPNCRSLRALTLEKARDLRRAGGDVIALGSLPTGSDHAGTNDSWLSELVQETFPEGALPTEKLIDRIATRLPLDVVSLDESDKNANEKGSSPKRLLFQHRSFGTREIYLLLGTHEGERVAFRSRGRCELWDPWTGTTRLAEDVEERPDGTTAIRLPDSNARCVVVVFSTDQQADFSAHSATWKPASAPITLDGLWDVTFVPTLENRWGDFRLPVEDKMIGVEARRFDYAECSAEEIEKALNDENLDTLFSDARTQTYGYGPKFYRIGPFPSGEETDRLAERLTPLTSVDPSEPVLFDGKEYRWTPYEFSWRDGIEGIPGHQGWHGLKKFLDDRFLGLGAVKKEPRDIIFVPEEEGSVYFLWTTVKAKITSNEGNDDNNDSAKNSPVEVTIEGDPLIAYLGGEKIVPNETPLVTSENATPLFLRCDAAGRRAIVFTQKDAQNVSQKTETDESTPLSMKWLDLAGRLDFDLHSEKERPQAVYRFIAPPGMQSMTITSKESLKVFVGGKSVSVVEGDSQFAPVGIDGAIRYSVTLETPCSEQVPVVLVLEPRSGDWGGAALCEPIRITCGEGKMPLGNWNQFGVLADYSGGVNYSKTFTLENLSPDERVTLNLGNVCASARVFVNEQEVGTLFASPWSLDISKQVKSGENQIRVEVRNSLSNHFRTIPSNYRGNSPSGLIGPVSVLQSVKE